MNEVAKVPVPASAPITKLPIQAGGAVAAIVPKTIDEAFRMAEAVCVSGMVPDSYKGRNDRETASKVLIGIMKGMEVGLPPVTALSNIYIVNNRPSLWGDAALALVQAHPAFDGCMEKIEGKPETDDYKATCTIWRKVGDATKETVRTFSWGDAKRAALVNKGPWRQYPQRMLQMRARAWCIRDSFADALSGLSIREEMEDMPTKAEGVDASFLDAGEVVTEPEPEQMSRTAQPEPEGESEVIIPPEQLMAEIRKGFIMAGDDKEKVSQTIQAAELIDLPEPFKSELAEVVATKKARFNLR